MLSITNEIYNESQILGFACLNGRFLFNSLILCASFSTTIYKLICIDLNPSM
jgi:hypothetical protein